MATILKLKGVGPALAKLLKAHGIQTVAELAAKDEQQLRNIPGVGESRAARLLGAAREAVPAETTGKSAAAALNGLAAPEQAASQVAEAEEASPGSQWSAKLEAAEAARQAAEDKAAKAQAKARKAKRKAAQLAEEFAEAKIKAKQKAKKVKAKARKAIEKEKAKAQAILDGQVPGKKKKKAKK